MASGLPVVATSVGDLPRVVLEGATGRLVASHSPEELADALESLVRDPALRLRMGAAGRRRVEERFDLSITCDKIQDVYEELLSCSPCPA